MKKIVIYPGRFHPFHKGHASVYNTLVKQFGAGNVYIATSDKVDPPKSPFTFSEKAQMMNFAGVPDSAIMLTKQPYRPVELLDGEDPDTVVMFAVSEKDMAEDPRFAFKPLKNGNPSYFQPVQGEMKGWEQHGYIITVPTLQFKVLDQPMKSATEFRRDFASADAEKQKAMITDLYGKYDMNIHSIMSNKITEAEFTKDKELSNLKTPKKPTKYARKKGIQKLDDSQNRINKIIETINELESSNALNQEQKLSILGKLQRLFIEMRLHRNRAVLESLYSVDKDDIMNSEVLVTGVGRYSIKGLMQNISAKLDDLSKEASEMTPYNYKNIKAKLDSGILTTMLNSLTDAFADLETMRRKGGANSRAIPKDMFDDVQLDELQVTQRDALRVLYNVAARSDNKPFPVKMYNKDVIGNPNAPGAGVGTVTVTPHQARLITKLYDTGDEKQQRHVERMLKTYGGWEELLKMIESVQKDSVYESLDNPYKLNSPQYSPGADQWSTTAKSPTHTIKFSAEAIYTETGPGSAWMFEFSTIGKHGSEYFSVTGEGDAQRVFATALAALKMFIDNVQPGTIRFSADKGEYGESRTKLYQRMIQKYASQMGYKPYVDKDEDSHDTFSLFKEAWSQKYKDSIDCSNPKGFSQKAHCDGRKAK